MAEPARWWIKYLTGEYDVSEGINGSRSGNPAHHREDALHLRAVAPLRERLTRIMRRMTVDAAFGGMLLHRADKDRQAYVQRYFHRDWKSDQLYHLQINTGHVTVDEAACMIERLVRGRCNVVEHASVATEE